MPVSEEAVRRYKARLAAHRLLSSAILVAAWDHLGSYDEEDVDRYTETTQEPLDGAKTATVALSAGFFALALALPPVAVDPTLIDLEPDFRGPFRAMWHAFTMGRPYDEALRVGRSTAEAVGFDFVQSVARRTGDHAAEASNVVVKWTRQPGPKACDWCRLVSGQLYNSAETADFGHERDGCVVVPERFERIGITATTAPRGA